MPRDSSSSSNAGASPQVSSSPRLRWSTPTRSARCTSTTSAGSDVVEAFTYNGHREKMRVIGKEDLLEPLNRAALQIAREVADAHPGDLMAGNISNTNIWDPADPQRQGEVRDMFREMVGWAVEGGADLIIGETFYYAAEALAASRSPGRAGCRWCSPSPRWRRTRWPTAWGSWRPASVWSRAARTSSA